MIWALSDTWYVFLRDLRTRIRMPMFIFMSLFQPVLWLLLFPKIYEKVLGAGGFSVWGPGVTFVQGFAPGVVVMTVLFGSAFSGMGMLMDMDSGVLSKMVATPVNRVSIITGRVIATVTVGVVQALIIFLIAAIMGVDVKTGVPGVLLALLLVALLGTGFAAFSNGIALLFKRHETVMATTNLLTMPLIFLSSTMMPGSALPDWLNTVRQFNPMDYAVVGIRTLMIRGWVWSDLWPSVVVLAAVAAVMVAFGTLMFRTRAE